MSTQMSFPKLRNVGINGILIQFSDNLTESSNRAAIAFANFAKQELKHVVEEVSATLTSTFVRFDPLKLPHNVLLASLDSLLEQQDWYQKNLPKKRRHFTIPCVFGCSSGPQFSEAAKAAGLNNDDAIKELTSISNRVLSIGFSPGQPYMGQLGSNWNFPRLKSLTPKVPKGALVVAIRQLIIFSSENPTGWYHIGQTGFDCFRPNNPEPFALRPGDEIILTSISQQELNKILRSDSSGNGGAEIRSI